MTDAYYRALLALPLSDYSDSSAGILHAGQAELGPPPKQSRHSGTLGHHDRSSSAPNVCLNNVKASGDEYPKSLALSR